MITRLKTSKNTENVFIHIGQNTGLQPFALSKLSIALSVKSKKPLAQCDFETDNNGLELAKQTIVGDFEALFDSLILNNDSEAKQEDLFPKLYKAHLDRGAVLLENEYKYDSRRFYRHLCSLADSI